MSGNLGAGWISGPIGDVAEQAQATADAFPSSNLDSVDLFSTTKQIARGIGNAQAEFGTVDEFGRQMTPPEPRISAEEANEKYSITPTSGLRPLKFDNPVPESVAQSMYAAKQDEITRAATADRAPPGIGNGLARFGLNLAAGFLDPVNAAAVFVPGIGEEAAARVLGLGLDSAGVEGLGIGARTATRALAGSTAGLAGGAALAGVHYVLGQQEQEDYSMSSMLFDVAMGGIMGGGLHAAIGGAGDVLGQIFGRSRASTIVDADPATRDAANRATIAALVEDRPVDVAPLIDLGGAQFDAAKGRAEIDRLYQQARELRGEIPEVPGAITDPATAERLSAIENELTDPNQTLTQNRKAALMQEHSMLTEGAQGDPDQMALDEARGASQRQGLQTALDRTNQQIVDIINQIRQSDAAKRAMGAPDPEAKAISDSATLAAAAPRPPEEKLERTPTALDSKATVTAAPESKAEGAENTKTAEPATEAAPKPMSLLEAAVKQMRDSGEMDPATTREYDGLAAQDVKDEGTAKALEAAAACMMGRV